MVISPPFLPVPIADESEAAWLLRAMQQPDAAAIDAKAVAGSFPFSSFLMWHTGLHLQAPLEKDRFLPVRAIADGELIYLRKPVERNAYKDHPQNYTPNNTVEWTDNGCVILKHQTDIGATHGIPTSFTYYSLTMHLEEIDPALQLHKKVYRKDVIGRAGRIYGGEGSIHFEICCDEAQLKRLVGREPAWVELETAPAPTSDGRTDCVWGDIAIYLPASTRTSRTKPKSALRDPSGDETRLGAPQWAIIHYEKGDCTIRAVDTLGKAIGEPIVAKDYEYEMYKTACDLHAAAAQPAGTSSPSGWYELLRFGRNLGPDPLPAMASHWREIPTPNGPLWVELNDPNSRKFSEADFLTVLGWKFLMDDDKHLDQRCQSMQAHRLIQSPIAGDPARFEPGHKNSRLGLPEVQEKLKHAICRFPTECDVATVEQRLGWGRDKTQTDRPVSDRRWAEFVKHCEATCASDLPQEYKHAIWRINPKTFIEMMKMCGWMSKNEVVRCFRKESNSLKIMMERLENAVSPNARTGGRPARLHCQMQNMMRKYRVSGSPQRLAYLFSQIVEETGSLDSLVEKGGKTYFDKYEPRTRLGDSLGNRDIGDGEKYKGRGLIQITGKFNYTNYFHYKGRVGSVEESSALVAVDAAFACDAAGFYWVSKQRLINDANKKYIPLGKQGINFWADRGVGSNDAQEVTKCINPGMLHFEEVRWPAFNHAFRALNDGAVVNVGVDWIDDDQ